MTDSFKRHYPTLLMLVILLIATAARFNNLGGQSLWYDEGVAFGHSQRSLWQMIPRLQNNVHVPAYFGSLALYEDFAGSTEFGLRSYSALWSILSAAVAYALGKRLFHPVAGLSAALFIALNSFSVYYAQETRMYAMLTAIGALSMWAFVKWAKIALRSNSEASIKPLWQWGLVFAIFNIIGEYTHVSYALVMVSQGMLALLVLANLLYQAINAKLSYHAFKRALMTYFAVNVLTVLLFAPWLIVAVSQVSAQPNISDPVPLAEVIRIIQGWFAFGRTYTEGLGGMNMVMYFLLLFGLLTHIDNRKIAWWFLLMPIVWVLVSVSIYMYLELYTRYLRFLLPAQVAFALWMGRGVWVLWEIVPRTLENRRGWQAQVISMLPKVTAILAVIAFAWQQFSILRPLYTSALYTRDDYRSLVATIETEADNNDAIILIAPGIQEIFGYYYEDTVAVYPLPASENIIADTQAIIDEHERLFVVFYGQAEQDPDNLVESTLNNHAFQISSEWVGDVRFERFASPETFDISETINVPFGDNITLQTIALSDTAFSPTDVIQIQLEWVTTSMLDTRYKVFLQLLDSNGELVAQRDSEPGGNQVLTTLWQPDVTVTDNHALAFSNLSTGDYTLIIGLYDINNPEARLSVGENDYYEIGSITIE